MKHKPTQFRKKLLASSISSCMLFGASAIAQENPPMEEVIVTGIRASLERSVDIKRDSKGVVDAITAEDIGKFPDSNLAESLQRITGVSIDRRNGEGSQITVRGFGPDFNMVTLNGRVMPVSSLDQNIAGGASTDGRAFEMDNIASEGVSGVQVYKTSKANISGGGIGATINLTTARPLDHEGLKVSVGAKALKDETNRIGSDITPELSGLVSWSDPDQRFGVAGSFSYQERDSASTGAFVNQWSANQAYTGTYPTTISEDDAGVVLEGPATQIENEPEIGEIVGNPSSLRYFHADRERKRTNGQLTFQFAPNEDVTATLDYTYAKQDLFQNRSEVSLWFQDFPRTDLVFDDEASPTPVLFWEESRDSFVDGPRLPRDVGFAMQQQNQVNELNSLGLNVEWQANDELSLVFDLHDSSSESRPDANFGNWANVSIGANVALDQGADWTTDIPVMMINFDDSIRPGLNGNGVLDVSDLGSQVMDLRRESAETDITQVRVDGTFEFDDNSKIDFGVDLRRLEAVGREAQKTQTLRGDWGVTNPGDVPEELLSPINYASLLGESLSSPNQAWFNDVGGPNVRPLTTGFYADAAELGRALVPLGGPNGEIRTFDIRDRNETPDSVNRTIEEDIQAIYVQFEQESTLGNMPLNILAGVRYEATEVTASADVVVPLFQWVSNDDFQISPTGESERIRPTGKADYNHLLPNLDLSLQITDNLVGRFSTGKTIARASFQNLSSAVSIGSGGPSLPTLVPGSVLGTASVGNPGLLPLESDNTDFSLEWYFDDASYASIGYFEKRVNNFIGTVPTPASFFGIQDPSAGPRAQAAVEQLEADGRALDASNLFIQVAATQRGVAFDSMTLEEWEAAVDILPEAGDPIAVFSAQVPSNVNNAKIEGFELAAQHFFADTGFGVIANYTIVNGDVKFDVTADPAAGAQFALVGLSDTANLSLIYENYGFSGRLSYNWRDDFLNDTAVTGNEPEFTEDYQQLDFTISYEITDGLFVSLDGINITEEDQRKHGRSKRQLTQYETQGARYALGVRYSF